MKNRITSVTWHYMMITAGFWMSFCIFTADAAIFLQNAGYNNQELGIIMAIGNTGGALLGPVLGSMIDRNRKIRHANVNYLLLALQAAFLILLWVNPAKSTLCAAGFVLYMACALPVNAINLDLCVRLEHAKAPLNFGLARSTGSLGFMVFSIIIGILLERMNYLVLPAAGLFITAMQAVGNRLVDRDLRAAEANISGEIAGIREKSAALPAFIRENKAFCLMLFGTILIYIAHNMDGNFLINLVENLGGTESTVNFLASFTALVEIPVMIFAAKLPKRWSTVQYIRISFIFFVLKVLAYALAPNIPLLYAARILQAPSYALYTVLIVGYADAVVARKDSAKAQSLAVSMTTIGSVLASLIGGPLFDNPEIGVRSTMLIASGIAAVGAVIALAGTRSSKL